jgi:hypothetical protein
MSIEDMQTTAAEAMLKARTELGDDDHVIVIVYNDQGYAIAASDTDEDHRKRNLRKVTRHHADGERGLYDGDYVGDIYDRRAEVDPAASKPS